MIIKASKIKKRVEILDDSFCPEFSTYCPENQLCVPIDTTDYTVSYESVEMVEEGTYMITDSYGNTITVNVYEEPYTLSVQQAPLQL